MSRLDRSLRVASNVQITKVVDSLTYPIMKIQLFLTALLSVLPAVRLGAAADVAAPTYRNVALNSNDVHEAGKGFPHAFSNSESRGESAFLAINAINGRTENLHHGDSHPSWGPEKRTDLWWKVDFGHEVEVDKVVIYIRADFPHDGYWHQGTLVFSDGSTEVIHFEKTAEPQTFSFTPRRTDSVTITDLRQGESLEWCAFTEVEVWGRDAH